MKLREIFTQLLADLSKLDSNEPVVVTYELSSKSLIYRQTGKLIILTYLNPFFFVKKNFKIGILTQSGLHTLRYEVEKLLSNNELDDLILIPNIDVLGTSFYKSYTNKELIGPQKVISLRYVSVSNNWMSKLFCQLYNDRTRLIYRSIRNSKYLNKERA